jgi:hypothetical protein
VGFAGADGGFGGLIWRFVFGLGIADMLRGRCLVGIGNEWKGLCILTSDGHIVREDGVTVNVTVTSWCFAAEPIEKMKISC